MKKLAITTALVGAMAFVGTASADEIVDTFTINVESQAYCQFEIASEKVINESLGGVDGTSAGEAFVTTYLTCNKDLPFTVDLPGVDAEGMAKLVGANDIGNQLSVQFNYARDDGDTGVLGSLESEAQFGALASGTHERVVINMFWDPSTFDGILYVPVDTYSRTQDVRLTF